MQKGVSRAALAVALTACFRVSDASAGDGIQDLAKSVVTAAAGRGVKRVAVVPFTGPRGMPSYSGSVVSERLVIQILARGDLDLVERRMLEKVLEEQRLGAFGIMDPGTVKALGKVLGVDAILTGSVVDLKRERVEINARLIHAETAQVLAAATAKADRDWEEKPAEDSSTWVVPVPELPDDQPAMSGGACFARADEIERGLIELKARYWAARLKDPNFSARMLTKNPGSEIKDLVTRRLFYSRLKECFDSAESQPLSILERAQLTRGLQEISVLTQVCGG